MTIHIARNTIKSRAINKTDLSWAVASPTWEPTRQDTQLSSLESDF